MHKQFLCNNLDTLSTSLNQSIYSLIISLNTIDCLIWSQEFPETAKKQKKAISSIINRISTVKDNLDKFRSQF